MKAKSFSRYGTTTYALTIHGAIGLVLNYSLFLYTFDLKASDNFLLAGELGGGACLVLV
jgi:hypothetical protein